MCIILTSIFCYPAYGTETARKIIWFCPDLRGTALFFMAAGYGQHNFYFAQHFENMECYPAAPYGPLAGPARNIDWHYERKYLRA